MSRRITTARLLELGEHLTETERELVRTVDRLRLVSHAQLAKLLDSGRADRSPISAARMSRRTLARLTDDGVFARLARRVGGLRAGSSGYVYYLGPVGQRLVAYWDGRGLTRGRFRPEPGGRSVRHRLAVSQLFVDLTLAARRGELELLAFDAEPDCWRSYVDGFGGRALVKPDAFVRVGLGAYEDRWFVEVDLATESRAVIARKARVYIDYFNSGSEQAAHGVFPRVLLLTNTEVRKAALVGVCARLPAEHWRLFSVGLLADVKDVLTRRLDDDVHDELIAGDAL